MTSGMVSTRETRAVCRSADGAGRPRERLARRFPRAAGTVFDWLARGGVMVELSLKGTQWDILGQRRDYGWVETGDDARGRRALGRFLRRDGENLGEESDDDRL